MLAGAPASCLRWPATPAPGHGQPLAEFAPRLTALGLYDCDRFEHADRP